MAKLLIFGGTTEGRRLCEACAARGIPALYCVATEDGARAVAGLAGIAIRAERLDAEAIADLLQQFGPALVIDATHPYAREASRNIKEACDVAAFPLLRVARENGEDVGDVSASSLEELLPWIEGHDGNIYATTGASAAHVLCRLPNFRERVWLRILPNLESLRTCLELDYHPARLVCMQGPFSEALNRELFRAANARILLTKNSGAAGGFEEKICAAKSLGMAVAVLGRPEETGGVSLEEAMKTIEEWDA